MKLSEAMQILGITDLSETKDAYRKILLRDHQGEGGDRDAFARLNEAYSICRDRIDRPSKAPVSQLQQFLQRPKSTFNESHYTKKVTAKLAALQAFTLKCHGGMMQASGMPDIYVACPAICECSFWMELKVNARVSDLQKVKMRELVLKSVPAFVLRWKHAKHIVEWSDGTPLSDPFTYDNFADGLRQGIEELRTLVSCMTRPGA